MWTIAIDDGYTAFKFSFSGHADKSIYDIHRLIRFALESPNDLVKCERIR